MTREYKKWKNRSTNKNEQLLKIQHYIKVRLLHDRQFTGIGVDEAEHAVHAVLFNSLPNKSGLGINSIQVNFSI